MHPSFDPNTIVDLDVRATLRAGQEPLPQILAAVRDLPPDGVLHLRTSFIPAPLLTLLAQQGFQHHTEAFADSDCSTWFWRGATPDRPPPPAEPGIPVVEDVTDLRLLPPPQPMLWIVERLEQGIDALEVYLPFYPEPLLPVLARYNYGLELVQQGSDGVHVRIARR